LRAVERRVDVAKTHVPRVEQDAVVNVSSLDRDGQADEATREQPDTSTAGHHPELLAVIPAWYGCRLVTVNSLDDLETRHGRARLKGLSRSRAVGVLPEVLVKSGRKRALPRDPRQLRHGRRVPVSGERRGGAGIQLVFVFVARRRADERDEITALGHDRRVGEIVRDRPRGAELRQRGGEELSVAARRAKDFLSVMNR